MAGASLLRSGWINYSIGSDGVRRECDFTQMVRSNMSCRKLKRPEHNWQSTGEKRSLRAKQNSVP